MSIKENQEKEIKKAFEKVKTDIFTLGKELSSVKNNLLDFKSKINYLERIINDLRIHLIRQTKSYDFSTKRKMFFNNQLQVQNQTQNRFVSTNPVTSTGNPTHNLTFKGLKTPFFNSSIGNGGVSTDRQTDQQTDRHISNYIEKPINQSILEASEALESLDSLKKEIRLKFKQITQQEMLVFSTIYQFEEQGIMDIDYSKIALRLGLSQSSIRDYVQRILNKGIPIRKIKLNNKKIILSISPDLKKITSLDTILRLREI